MKNKLIILTILLASTICYAREFTKQEVLKAIAEIESGNKAIGRHTDGVSYGRYGMTYVAIAELKRIGIIPKFVKYDLRNDWENRKAASLYLKYCKERFKCSWIIAGSYYHSFTKSKREKYLKKIKNKLKRGLRWKIQKK